MLKVLSILALTTLPLSAYSAPPGVTVLGFSCTATDSVRTCHSPDREIFYRIFQNRGAVTPEDAEGFTNDFLSTYVGGGQVTVIGLQSRNHPTGAKIGVITLQINGHKRTVLTAFRPNESDWFLISAPRSQDLDLLSMTQAIVAAMPS